MSFFQDKLIWNGKLSPRYIAFEYYFIISNLELTLTHIKLLIEEVILYKHKCHDNTNISADGFLSKTIIMPDTQTLLSLPYNSAYSSWCWRKTDISDLCKFPHQWMKSPCWNDRGNVPSAVWLVIIRETSIVTIAYEHFVLTQKYIHTKALI